ncbi:MAG: amino acid ABC transporter permease [Holosporaceae bacterium]|jgi:polar amino acid transport system permease protein|nr:amino acid ABC transporter permease [Holosporaceae bacterium]
MDKLISDFVYIGAGLAITLQLLVGSFLMGIVVGSLLSIIRVSDISKICTFLIERVISVIRGTPLVLQLSLIYFSVPGILDIKLSALSAGIVAFGINSSAYISEILRAGIESLPQGQFEAARTLGIPKYYMWKDIIMPQVIANIYPAMINEIIALLKETALIVTIGGMDIMRRSQIIAAERYEYFAPLCIAGAYYYLLVVLIEFIGKKIENRKIKC